jgi:hypothetical protein
MPAPLLPNSIHCLLFSSSSSAEEEEGGEDEFEGRKAGMRERKEGIFLREDRETGKND